MDDWITTETLRKIESRRKLKDKVSNSRRTRAARRETQKQYNKANQEMQELSGMIKDSLLTIWQKKQKQQQINTG